MQVARVKFYGVLAAFDGDLHRCGTRLREFILAAVHFDLRIIEVCRIAFMIGVVDVFVDRQQAAALSLVADGEFQHRALVFADAELVYLPLQRSLVEQFCAALVGLGNREKAEAVRHALCDDNIGCAGLTDILRQILKQLFRLVIVRCDGDIGGVGIGCPIPQCLLVNAAAAVSPKVTSKVPPRGIVTVFSSLVELVMPIGSLPS